MEILHNNTHEHVEQKEADQEKKCDEVKDPPLIVVLYWLQQKDRLESFI